MRRISNFFKIPKYHQSALADSLLTVCFTIQPTIFLTFSLLSKGQPVDISKSYIAGEFFLYSISFLSTSYLVFNQFKVRATDWKSNLNKIVILLLSVISGFYGLTSNNSNLDLGFMKVTSIIAFVISFAIFYNAQVISHKNSPDVAEERREEQQVIEDALS